MAHAAAARRAVFAGFVVLFAAVMVAEYFFFRRAFAALGDLGLAGSALTLYLLESVLVIVFALALLSFVASGLWVYYRAGDTRFLLAAPLPAGGLFALRVLETFGLTSWALAVVGLPALLALGTAYGHGGAFYVEGAAVLGLFAILTGSAGALLTAIAGAALRRTRSRLALALLVGTVLLALIGLVGRNVMPSAGDFYAIFEPGMLNGKPASIKFIETRFALWPSHPFAAALYTAATGGRAGSAATRTTLYLAPLALLLAVATVGRALYARTLPAVAESSVLAGGRAGVRRVRAGRFPRWLRGPIGAMAERDLVTIARSPHELGRAAFITLLLLLYTSFIVVAPLREVGHRPEAVARLLLFTVIATGYFLTAFGLRFVFPSMSLEGRAAWVFFSCPIRVFRLLLAKAALSVTLLALAVVPIAMIGVLRLVREPALAVAVGGLLLMVAATTTTMLLAFGAAWPDFRETNPEALSTSGGGLGGTVACLVYVAGIGMVARAAALAEADGRSVVPWLMAAGLASGALIAGALGLVYRRIPRLEAP